MTNTTGGLFGTAVRGHHKGTNGFGVGVSGIHDGGGFGVYGKANTGYAFYGVTQSGTTAYFGNSAPTGTALIADGRVAIRTTSPGNYALQMRQTNDEFGLDIVNSNSSTNWELYTTAGENGRLNFLQTTTAGGFAAWLNSSGLITTSDQRLKSDWVMLPNVMNNVKKLNPVSYTMTHEKTGQRYTGFLAQEVQQLFPMLVDENDLHGEKRIGVNYGAMSVVAIKAIQEQQAQIEAQQQQIQQQEQRLQQLEADLAELRKLLKR
jgi:hypothetical protein